MRRRSLPGARALVLVVLLLVLTTRYAAEPVRVESSSMSPTLRPGEHVLVLKRLLAAQSPSRGDIVVFSRPSAGMLVKRVAAVAGDNIGIEDGVLVLNGRPVAESYVDYPSVDSTWFGPVTVPDGTVFVLGDDRANSVDSRSFGPVGLDAIDGRVWGGLGGVGA